MVERVLIPLAVVAAGFCAYRNSFHGPFIFDDAPHILRNHHIRQLWPPWETMAQTTRPLVQLSFALNYAVSGLEVWSYHALNLLIHVLAGLALLGVLRRTFAGPALPDRYRDAAPWLGLAATLIWLVHPLQTEAVTYVVQRSESLAALFYLLTLYGLIRGAGSGRATHWYAAAVVTCALGMGSKPVMATAPLVVMLYDRVFLSRSFRELWAARRGLYVGLFATLGLLPLMFANGAREWRTSAGLGVPGLTPLMYAGTEPGVVLHYMRLCLWPHPLCLDYGWPIATNAGAIVAPALGIAAIGSLTAWSLWRGSRLGFLGAWFFLILAPTSSLIPVADPAFEHRLYLPLAAISVLATLGGYEAIRAMGRRLEWSTAMRRTVAGIAFVTLVGALAVLTVRRNADYRSDLAIWSDTLAKRPGNLRARLDVGLALLGVGRVDEALARFREVLLANPQDGLAHLALGMGLRLTGRSEEALPHCREAVRLLPENGEARFLLGSLLIDRGAIDEGYENLVTAQRLEPERAATHYSIGLVLELRGKTGEAIRAYSEAVRLKPDYADAHCGLGLALMHEGRLDEARRELETALALQPDHARARQGLEELRRHPLH